MYDLFSVSVVTKMLYFVLIIQVHLFYREMQSREAMLDGLQLENSLYVCML